ncbi:MAG: hypothetical protein P8170_14320 [Gemmatimonadota bacterium]|jgi:hypothetical protein
MTSSFEYSPAERRWLSLAAVIGFFGLNAVFIYGLVRPEVMQSALTNPVSLAFMAEALLLLVLLAYLLPKWGVGRLRRTWFVALALLGSLAFALPVMLLWRGRPRRAAATERETP